MNLSIFTHTEISHRWTQEDWVDLSKIMLFYIFIISYIFHVRMSKIRLCFFCPSRNILSTRSDMVMVRPRRGCEEECGCGYDWYGSLPHWPSVSRPHTEYASCNPTREMGDHYFMQRFIFWRITCQSSICRRAMHWLESALLRKTAYNKIAFRKKSWDECIKSTLTYLDISAQIVETKFYLGTALDIVLLKMYFQTIE